MSANLGRNRLVTPVASLLCLVALVAVRRYETFVFLRLAAFTQRYALPARRLNHALRVACRTLWFTTVLKRVRGDSANLPARVAVQAVPVDTHIICN